MHKVKLATAAPACKIGPPDINNKPEPVSQRHKSTQSKDQKQEDIARKVKDVSKKDSQMGASMIVVVTRENRSFYVCPDNSPVANESV